MLVVGMLLQNTAMCYIIVQGIAKAILIYQMVVVEPDELAHNGE